MVVLLQDLQVFKIGKNKMIEIFLIIGIIFIICLGLWFKKLTDEYIDEQLLKQKQLNESFNRNKLSGGYIKK